MVMEKSSFTWGIFQPFWVVSTGYVSTTKKPGKFAASWIFHSVHITIESAFIMIYHDDISLYKSCYSDWLAGESNCNDIMTLLLCIPILAAYVVILPLYTTT